MDKLSDALLDCMKAASHSTMPTACPWHGAPARLNFPWYDQDCRDACNARESVEDNSHSTAAQRKVAEKQYHSVTDRKKIEHTRKGNAELCDMAAKDPSHFWKVFKASSHNFCLVTLSAQIEAFRASMGAQPAQGTESSPSGVSNSCTPDAACLNADIKKT